MPLRCLLVPMNNVYFFLTSLQRAHLPPPAPHSNGADDKQKTYDSEVLETFSGRTSLLGVAYIRESRHVVIKLIWLVIFLVMLGMSAFQLVGVFRKYFE